MADRMNICYISFAILANPIKLENVQFLQGGDFVWICMWFIQKHNFFKKKESMMDHKWDVSIKIVWILDKISHTN